MDRSFQTGTENRCRAAVAPWLDGTFLGSFSAMSEDLKARLRDDLVVVRKARNRLGTVVLTTLLSEVRNREIEVGKELDDEGIQAVVAKAISKRRDPAEQMLEASFTVTHPQATQFTVFGLIIDRVSGLS